MIFPVLRLAFVSKVLTKYSMFVYYGPRSLHTKLQKMQLSSIHTTIFFHNCNDFFHSFLYVQRFSCRLFSKIFAVSCVVYKGLYRRHLLQVGLRLTCSLHWPIWSTCRWILGIPFFNQGSRFMSAEFPTIIMIHTWYTIIIPHVIHFAQALTSIFKSC